MGEEDEKESIFSSVKFPLYAMDSPQHPSGNCTPPLQTLASIPFKWEEQPGKPRPCTDIIPRPEPVKSLELPPCRIVDPVRKMTKTPSPTTVLDGPYNVGRSKFSSFRFFREGHDSFDSCSLDDVLIGKNKKKRWFGKIKGGRKGFDGGSSRFSSPSIYSWDGDESCSQVKNSYGGKMGRNGSFYTSAGQQHARPSRILATICERLKQVVRWKSS